jgi:striatin 1/3/4
MQIQLLPAQPNDEHPSNQPDAHPERQSDEPLTAIFRPDETWREQLNSLRRGSPNTQARSFVNDGLSEEHHATGAASWDGRPRDEDDDIREDEEDGEVDEVNVTGEGDVGKVWRAKKTLRK